MISFKFDTKGVFMLVVLFWSIPKKKIINLVLVCLANYKYQYKTQNKRYKDKVAT